MERPRRIRRPDRTAPTAEALLTHPQANRGSALQRQCSLVHSPVSARRPLPPRAGGHLFSGFGPDQSRHGTGSPAPTGLLPAGACLSVAHGSSLRSPLRDFPDDKVLVRLHASCGPDCLALPLSVIAGQVVHARRAPDSLTDSGSVHGDARRLAAGGHPFAANSGVTWSSGPGSWLPALSTSRMALRVYGRLVPGSSPYCSGLQPSGPVPPLSAGGQRAPAARHRPRAAVCREGTAPPGADDADILCCSQLRLRGPRMSSGGRVP
jgi:hypothetical protein